MYKFIFALSMALIFGACKPRQITITPEVYENFVQVTYENVQDNTTHYIENFVQANTEMYSFGNYSPVDFVTQNIRPVYYLGTYPVLEEVPQLLLINFTHDMPAADVEPITGQSYGQLYTYTDREQYTTDFFAAGRVFNQPEELFINFQVGSITSGTRNEDNPPFFELTIDKSAIFDNAEGQKSIYVEGHFRADLLVSIGYNNIPIGTSRYKITDAKFGFVKVVDGI